MGNFDSTSSRGGSGVPPPSHKDAANIQLKALLSAGEIAARAGQRGEARRLFREALTLDPANEQAWLWLAFLAPSPRQSLAYLQQARTYHPRSERVRQAIDWAQGLLAQQADGDSPPPSHPATRPRGEAATERHMASPKPVDPPTPRRPLLWLWIGLALAALVGGSVALAYALRTRVAHLPYLHLSWLMPAAAGSAGAGMALLRVQAGEAISREAWGEAIPYLESMRQLAPEDDGVRQQLAVAHLRHGLYLVDHDRLDEAIAHYDAAIRFYANDMDLQASRRLAIGYRDGRRALEEQRWADAAELLEPVHTLAPAFRDVAILLYNAHLQRAQQLEAAGQLPAARDAYARAVAVRPDPQVQAKLAGITAILTPPTPTPSPRPRQRIEVSVSEQRLRAYENGTLVFDWPCSTGLPTMPTRYGTFQILDRIPEAWSSVWGLRMPYWMGIYWAGGSQNGIHALPIQSNGTVMWEGYLGRRITYGCIVLDTPNAAKLYHWAEIGTPVTIKP